MGKTYYSEYRKPGIGILYKALLGILLLASTWNFGHATYIFAKAQLAQLLIANAWEQQQLSGNPVNPWPWADTFPVAKMTFPDHNEQLYVLASGTEAIIAFGPGHIAQSALPGQPGNSVFVGHNDTHFSFLRDVARGEVIEITTSDDSFLYQLDALRIAHESEVEALDLDPTLSSSGERYRLTLITCYPFDSVASDTEYRYLVQGKLISSLQF